jgi:hypothetical protein
MTDVERLHDESQRLCSQWSLLAGPVKKKARKRESGGGRVCLGFSRCTGRSVGLFWPAPRGGGGRLPTSPSDGRWRKPNSSHQILSSLVHPSWPWWPAFAFAGTGAGQGLLCRIGGALTRAWVLGSLSRTTERRSVYSNWAYRLSIVFWSWSWLANLGYSAARLPILSVK